MDYHQIFFVFCCLVSLRSNLIFCWKQIYFLRKYLTQWWVDWKTKIVGNEIVGHYKDADGFFFFAFCTKYLFYHFFDFDLIDWFMSSTFPHQTNASVKQKTKSQIYIISISLSLFSVINECKQHFVISHYIFSTIVKQRFYFFLSFSVVVFIYI